MNQNTRRQLTLFLDKKYTSEIEKIRKKYNPEQFRIIPSHVTLCREDEIENMPRVLENLKALALKAITVNLGEIVRFSNDKGVLIAAGENNSEYHHLREKILENTGATKRLAAPHITLMHPRNSSCTTEIFEEILKTDVPKAIVFEKISIIEQIGNGKWNVVGEYGI
ncbi:2'-5' RNA ligase family protein [Flavobacterium humi]|uniref:2'-5' RNA ligase family protein n=1 Tax=Flavobacterium humi TaxID=2562683 RepID=A0A4Z0LD35_9FLAO|nr:2'-5' RNA ligase family protein [Flavobacterium humi]TGD59800.1 2'-5' RNA ligase family protein [Flavobacterium humi]